MNSRVGDLCVVQWPFCVDRINHEGATESYEVQEGETFILLSSSEVNANNTIEFIILYKNMKMWFNIHSNDCMMLNVRRAESYDIPFMTLQEAELGSNTLTS